MNSSLQDFFDKEIFRDFLAEPTLLTTLATEPTRLTTLADQPHPLIPITRPTPSNSVSNMDSAPIPAPPIALIPHIPADLDDEELERFVEEQKTKRKQNMT